MDKEPHEFVEEIVRKALDENASDIFFLPGSDSYIVRMRAAGTPRRVAEVPLDFGSMCVSHIKSLASLLTYRTKIAQDGAIRGGIGGEDAAKFGDAELRVSTFPTTLGERVAIRVVREADAEWVLDDLGFQPEARERVGAILAKPSGLLVLTGPTGCGKTTTIYAMVRDLLKSSHDPAAVITIEDPVERNIKGVSQTSVSKGGDEWNYAMALRAALRQDVKTLVIGEMRDKEVVKVALDAALTGHRVITTFHAGDIPSVYARILHQGFEPFLVAAAVSGVVTQRLVQSADGARRIPVVAALDADDEWKDFIASGPTLRDIRVAVKGRSGADLATEAESMEKAGVVAPGWRLRL